MRIKSIVVLLAAALIAFGGVFADAAFDKDELKCRKGLAKGMLKAISTADKTSASCHKSRHSGKEPAVTDCNDLGSAPGSPGAADLKGKFAKAQQKLIDTPAKKCAGLDTDVLSQYVSCPEPCNTTLGVNNPMTTLDEAAACMACMAADVVSTKNTTLLGAPDPGLMSNDDTKCAQSIAKGYGKYLSTILKTRTKCQDTFEKDGGTGLDATCQTSSDPDGKGKIAKALTKADDGIDKSCAGADLNNVGSCSTVDLPNLKTCAAGSTDTADTDGYPLHYAMASTVCPIAVDSVIKAGIRNDFTATATSLNAGWNGIGHGQDLVDGYTLSADLTCPGSPPCGSCTIDGISATGPQYADFARCREDTAIPCTNPFGTDPVCPGTQDCSYFAGPPLPASASNVMTCILVRFANDISGSFNPDDGSAEQNLDISVLIHLGLTLTKPCPICVDDTTPQDGIKDGTCSGGIVDGDPCDVQGFSPTFAPGAGTSLDCPPSIDTNISGAGLALDVPSTTGSTSLPFGTKCDFPLTALDCACAMCSGDTSVSCNSNTDCSMIAAGTCTSKGSGESRAPNGCSDGNCTAGECLAGVGDDIVQYCDGQLRANGVSGLITCNANNDCDAVAVVCGDGSPGSCGTCTLLETRRCYNDPIVASGTPDLENPVLAATFCTSPTNNIGVNGATGLPGASSVTIESATSFRY
jgi:hypothetical protein